MSELYDKQWHIEWNNYLPIWISQFDRFHKHAAIESIHTNTQKSRVDKKSSLHLLQALFRPVEMRQMKLKFIEAMW